MSDEAARNAGEIETLLATRQRISEWLHRLGQAASDVPASVRDRVRSDYQGRLAKVVEELRGHSSAITGNLQKLRQDLTEREKVRNAEEEALAEAKLRHSVGEYAEEEWRAHEERGGTRLEALGAELHGLGSEIARLEEVLTQITGAPAPAPAAPKAEVVAEVEPVDDDDAMPSEAEAGGEVYQLGGETFITLDEGTGDPRTQSIFDGPAASEESAAEMVGAAPPEAPRFTPRSGAIPPRPRQSARPVEEEMAFLKSVMTEAPPARSTATSEKRNAAGAAAAVATKTLKCQDCGSLNRPTEWYCERCGAELSAV